MYATVSSSCITGGGRKIAYFDKIEKALLLRKKFKAIKSEGRKLKKSLNSSYELGSVIGCVLA